MDDNINNENSKLIKVTTMDILHENNNIVLSEINNDIHCNPQVQNNVCHNFEIEQNYVNANANTNTNVNESDQNNNLDNVETPTTTQQIFHTINEKGTSIFLHVLIMATFEIYFYFNYVIELERKLLIDKIKDYLSNFNDYFIEHSTENLEIAIKYVFGNFFDNDIGTYLENQYLEAKEEQQALLHTLLLFCYKLLAFLSCCLLFFIGCGFLHKKNVKWRWIIIENIVMLALLGALE